MTTTISTAHVWHFDATRARLTIGPLQGEVAISDPAAGIAKLTWHNTSIAGSVLGVSAGAGSTPQDSFARENDLVAVYEQLDPQRFLWQVYWRVLAPEPDVALIDVILSLQTPLLESFPRIDTLTQLPSGAASEISGSGDTIVLRPGDCDWTYTEMTHPKDRGTLEVASLGADGQFRVVRHLGGQFLEKGVIRRLRLRGAFFPRKCDSALIERFQHELASEVPPLTA